MPDKPSSSARVSRSYSVAVGNPNADPAGISNKKHHRKGVPALSRLDTSGSQLSENGVKTRARRAASTISASDSWGIHSVPGLLSDFRKHTSQTQRERSSIASPLATRPPLNPLGGGALSKTLDDIHKTLSEISLLSPSLGPNENEAGYFPDISNIMESSQENVHSHDHTHTHNHDHGHSHSHTYTHEHIHDDHSHAHGVSEKPSLYSHDLNDSQYSITSEASPTPSVIERVPALISLPTSLLALDFICMKLSTPGSIQSFLSTTIVTGPLLITAGILTLVMNRHPNPSAVNKIDINNTLILAGGALLLFWACSLLGSVKSCLVMATLFNAPYLFLHPFNFTYYLYVFILFIVDAVKNSDASVESHLPIWKLFSCYLALIGASYCLHRPSASISGIVSLLLGLIILIPAAISVTHITVDALTLISISSGSLGVFLVSKRDLHPHRLNATISSALSIFLERSVLVKSDISYTGLISDVVASLFSAILIPDTLYPRSAALFDPSSPPESIRNWGIIDSILAHNDTKNIFYFLLLNFSFMLIQLLYSILSHSLGLLSDSIHMFFDCLALFVGLIASILSKLPPSSRFPYGLGKVETLSGFTNGFLLIGISLGVIAEAVERISTPVELEKTTELLIVSILGLLVNVVGIFAFNHGHGHGHGHSHGHSHGASHSHSHDHGHEHSHEEHNQSHEGEHEHAHDSHDDEEENENMRGILLHIIADTLGSVGVIISTILVYYFKWEGFDPIASILIAILIFMSAVPLISSSAKTLLLSLKSSQEYNVRNMLSDISVMPGVAGYTVPRFWADGSSIRGVLHVQVQQPYDTPQVKEMVENKLAAGGVKAFVQAEPEGSNCWCRHL